MFREFQLPVLTLVCISLVGCGGARPIKGGTAGKLHSGVDPLGDIQVTFHQTSGTTTEPIGFGATTANGTFELVTMGAKGPLRLSPGQYLCTIESVGSPLKIPKEYTKPETTPLKLTWTSSDTIVDLDFQPSK